MTDDTKKSAEEQELVPIVDDNEEEQTPETPPAAEEPPAQDARVDNSDDDDDDGDEAPAGASDEERENINRKRRQQRREAQRRARERTEQMLAETIRRNQALEQRLAQLERHTVTSTLNDVDQRIARAEADAEQALNIHAAAIEAGNGKDAAAAQRIREAATEEARRLKAQREQLAAEVEQAPPPAQPSGPDPRVVSHAKNWIEENPWYDPNLGNDESKIAKQIDEQLVREGYNPASREHWVELTSRLNRVFSAVAEGGDEPSGGAKKEGRKGPPTSSTRETGGRQLKPNEIYIAPERKQAMMEAGIWDDPVRRQRALKEYQRFDAENSAR